MGIMLNKQDDNEELTNRINADLRRKMAETNTDDYTTDFATDVEYLKETKSTGKFSWIWIVLSVLALASLVFIIIL